MGMYDLYRRLSLESLQAEAELRASQLADAYQASLAALGQQQQQAARYGSTPGRDAWHQAAQQRLYAEYSAQLDDLCIQIAAQAAQIDADYNAKDQAYAGAMGALRDAPNNTPRSPLGFVDPPLAPSSANPYAPRVISDTPASSASYAPDWATPDETAEPAEPSIWGRIASLFA